MLRPAERAAALAAAARAEAAAITLPSFDSPDFVAAITRVHTKLVEHHGKSGCDGNSNGPKYTVAAGIKAGTLMLDPGTRDLVLFLAQHKLCPSIPKSKKRGWEAVGRIFYGYMNTDLFSKFKVPEASGWKGCRDDAFYAGHNANHSLSGKGKRWMQARKLICSCDACLRGRYECCSKVAQLGGKMHRVQVEVTGDGLNQPQLASLEAWSKYLTKGTLFAVNSDPCERREGLYWLARALGPAYPAPARMVHATDQFEEGWLVVPAQWYWLEQISERGYRIMSEERLIPVSTTVRLKDIKFSRSQGGPQQRELRGRSNLEFLSEDMHNAILAACTGE